MALFKCKMCGGSLEIAAGTTVIECEYCGTKQTLPKLDDDKRANMYDRANHFRRNNEFDKAMGIYEQILNEDSTDAEAYWSLVLCRYGIEYVEDPSTKRRIPTVNRAQYTSILADEDYKSALANADTYQKSIYELEAKAIDEIQKGILAISQKEEPFDVFICYKESDASGKRTQDSVLAQDLYFGLKNEGFKVFFARITLEDKLGSAYEPYIFAALNSAKVMVVLGTKPEFFSAVWVKNEWSRYLALIKQGQKKMLIPAYKDMDPYDLPEEFSHLQAQDMSKLGFMQDLIRGIKKIVKADEPKATVVKETVVKETVSTGAANTAPLLKRAFLFLEDGDWESADEYCEKALDADPENARAYIVKLMIEFEVQLQEDLRYTDIELDNVNYKKALRFADADLKETLAGYVLEERYESCEYYIEKAEELESDDPEQAISYYKKALTNFEEIEDLENILNHSYKDSAVLREQCYKKISELNEKIAVLKEEARKDEVLASAKSLMEENKIVSCEEAIELLSTISGWKDADALVAECPKKIEELKVKAEADRVEAERLSKIRAKRNKKIAIIATPIVCAIIAFIIVLNTVIIPSGKYNDAVALMDAGTLDEAYNIVKELGNFKDSDSISEELKAKILKNAEDLYYAGEAQSAADMLSRCGIEDPGYGAVAKGDYEYATGRGLTNIVIPDGATSIDSYAFWKCPNLTSITIPNSVTSIGDYAFSGCTKLTSITIPNSVAIIGDSAFVGCTKLTSINVPNSVTEIGISAFKDCTSLTSITIPNKVSIIKGGTFEGCTNLTSITIPNSVTIIVGNAFEGCTSLTSITIPNGVTEIDMHTFKGCTSLTSITIPNSVTEIGWGAFEGCTGLTSITIPNSVTEIGSSAFSGCTGLTNIIIPNSVTEIGSHAFELCTSLTSITIPDSLTSTGSYVFYKCTSLTSITFEGTKAQWEDIAFGAHWNKELLTNKVTCSNGSLLIY